MTPEMAGNLADPAAVSRATEALLMPEPFAVTYACSSGSFLHGALGEQRLVDALLAGGAPAASTTSGAMVRALQRVDARRVALATPYVPPIAARLRDVLHEYDFEVVS